MVWVVIATVVAGSLIALLAAWSMTHAARNGTGIVNQVRYLVSGVLMAASVPISLLAGSLLLKPAAQYLDVMPLPVGPEVVCTVVCAAALAAVVGSILPTNRELYANYFSGGFVDR